MAVQWMGWETVAFCEKEKYAKRVLGRHWPKVPVIDDIRNITEKIGCDIITGGFPCQPFSVAGKQKGKADDRYLWPEMLRIIALERPSWVIGENVAGIVSLELDQVLSDLDREGYSSRPIIIPAVAVDAPHRRDRIWIVANRHDTGRIKQRRPIAASPENKATQCISKWASEPCVGRVADGVPNRVDRVKALGNAIVPQVAYEILQAIAHDNCING